MRLGQAKDCSIQKYLEKLHQNAVFWCKVLLLYQTRSHAIVLYDTLRRRMSFFKRYAWLESTAGCTKIEFANWSTRSTWTGCKNILWPTKRIKQNLGNWEQAVEQQDTHRKDKVKQLIEKFENHTNKESFLQDFKQTKEINEISKESQDLIADMNNTEIFVLHETSSELQCSGCNLLGSRHCLLFVRKMPKNIVEWKGGRQERQRCRVDTRLCYQEE